MKGSGSKVAPHKWRQVPPVVAAINNPNGLTETYNAICETCGRKAWLHWPPPKQTGGESDQQLAPSGARASRASRQ